MTYTVKLTEEERNEALAGGLPPWLRRNIKSVRPEHPERQATLERLRENVLWLDSLVDLSLCGHLFPDNAEPAFAAVLDTLEKLRSLEGK
jgi:hypothetical protein